MAPPQNIPLRGRGTADSRMHRFSRIEIEPDPEYIEQGISPRTRFYRDDTSTAIASNDSPDIPFEKSINPYRGCEHGCIYCYARPYHEYLNLSPGIDFETKIMIKKEAPALLKKELSHPKWKPQNISISGATDPYQPVERRLGLTRACLQVLVDFRNPFTIVTKNHLVTRDLDLFEEMARYQGVRVIISLTSLNSSLINRMEPRTSRPEKRLKAIRELSKAGIPVGVLVAPIIPGLNDDEIPALISEARNAGAQFGSYVVLRLPDAVSSLFSDWLEEHYPDRKKKILSRISSIRKGSLNDSRFGYRMSGTGAFSDQIRTLFRTSCLRYGLNQEAPELSADHFRRISYQMAFDF
ncbi:PA0069 family radical SAM protein [Balneolaceae bacterium ANBcel3]|nr:PA0069 family radical SAM protein [Balneolaceae bacterium ANBcel3]